MPKVSADHLERRRTEILAGARRCFARHGYEGATVGRLEEEIGLSRGAIFHYFPDKLHLFLALAVDDFRRLPHDWPRGDYDALVRATAHEDPDWVSVYLEFVRLARTDARARAAWEAARPQEPGYVRMRQWIEEEQRNGTFRSDVPASEIELFLSLVLNGLNVHVALAREAIDVEYLLRLVHEAIAAPPRQVSETAAISGSSSARARQKRPPSRDT